MSSKFDWDKYEVANSNESDFDWGKYKEEPSRARSLISAAPKGALKEAQSINPFGVGPISKELGNRILETILPTQNREEERFLERGGKIAALVAAGPESIPAKLAQVAGGTILGHAAGEAGTGEIGQALAESGGMSLPGLASGLGKGAYKKAAQLIKSPKQKMASGLTEPTAVGSKLAEKAIVTPSRQENTIKSLDQEAAKIAEETIEKHAPLSKKIKEGHDFHGDFDKGFSDLKKSAKKYNPEIDITDVGEFLSKSVNEYRGIPHPHADARKILKEARAFRNRPQTSLNNLLSIYRSNNKKMRDIFETSRLTGKQQEYVDFLTDMNRSIASSFERTLPADSFWIKEFKSLNSDYKQFQNAQKALNKLKPLTEGISTDTFLKNASENQKFKKEMSLYLGKEGSETISQLSKDLLKAKNSIKNISAKELKIWDAAFPLAAFIPGLKIPGGIAAARKSADFLRRGYGFYLTQPKIKKSYDQAIRAISEKDFPSYVKAAADLESAFTKDREKTSQKSPTQNHQE